jgi:DNA invertase Pin-like site-specific DNA recombinase
MRPDHLERRAFIYVRQSTLLQVREYTASTARQYDLVQRAHDLGWAREHITVIDQDQGHSGASMTGRDGFQALIAAVGLGQAGAVLSLEVSRLARPGSDGHRLIEICALTETLVIDEEGVYAPGHYHDRLRLGFKGTMSEAALHGLRSRLEGGKRKKAEDGQLRFRPPAGLVGDPTGRILLAPDAEVQHAGRRVFDLFAQWGSALAVVKHLTTHHRRFPHRLWGQRHEGEWVGEPWRHGQPPAVAPQPRLCRHLRLWP